MADRSCSTAALPATDRRREADVEARVATLVALLRASEERAYIGEGVSQLAHALQAAHLAVRARAPRELVLAALLHDVAHLCAGAEAPSMDELGVLRHEEIGADHLAALGFSDEVTEAVRGHVAAKRYLVATRPAYAARLSEASRGTLAFQGGPMSADERRAFERHPRMRDVLRLRGWDEGAKVRGLDVPGLDAYVPLLTDHLRER